MMSSESLALAVKRRIPSANFEFCLTSADILFAKPSKNIFNAALNYAGINACECWYCGDGKKPDVFGADISGISHVLLDTKSETPIEFRSDEYCKKYLAVNNWFALKEYIQRLN